MNSAFESLMTKTTHIEIFSENSLKMIAYKMEQIWFADNDIEISPIPALPGPKKKWKKIQFSQRKKTEKGVQSVFVAYFTSFAIQPML